MAERYSNKTKKLLAALDNLPEEMPCELEGVDELSGDNRTVAASTLPAPVVVDCPAQQAYSIQAEQAAQTASARNAGTTSSSSVKSTAENAASPPAASPAFIFHVHRGGTLRLTLNVNNLESKK